jgi:hypothetical protein
MTASSDPGGPGPKPSGPTHPTPTAPRPRNLAGEMLRAVDNQLAELLEIADKLPRPTDRIETCGQAILAFRLNRARKAVADLLAYPETPARQCLSSAAAVADRPVKPRVGEPPLPDADFLPEMSPGRALMAAAFARRAD